MTQSPVRLPLLLGDVRKYIHGADLFDALTSVTGADGPARLRLLRLSDRSVYLHFGRPSPACTKLCGYFDFTRGGVQSFAWLQESDTDRVTGRSPLMDMEAVEAAKFDADCAKMERDGRFSVCKSGLILAVTLLERMFPDDAWNLAEVESLNANAGGRVIAVRLTRRIGKFLFASIDADHQAWGRLTLASTPYVESV